MAPFRLSKLTTAPSLMASRQTASRESNSSGLRSSRNLPSQQPTNSMVSIADRARGAERGVSSTVSQPVTWLVKHQSWGREVVDRAAWAERKRASRRLRWGSERMKVWMCISRKWVRLLGMCNCAKLLSSLLMKCYCRSCCRQARQSSISLFSLRMEEISTTTWLTGDSPSPHREIFTFTPVQISVFPCSMQTQQDPARLSSTPVLSWAGLRCVGERPSVRRPWRRALRTYSFSEGAKANMGYYEVDNILVDCCGGMQLENHSIWNLVMKDSRIYLERLIQLSRRRLSLRRGCLGGEKRFFRSRFMAASTCFFLKLLTSFLERESSMRAIVSYMPPSSLIFLAMRSVWRSKYSLVLRVVPLGCSRKISCVFRQLSCSLSMTGRWRAKRTVFMKGLLLAQKSL